MFRVSSEFDPHASAVRIAPDRLVTNRHGVADESKVEITLPGGDTIAGEVIPTAFEGDLVLVSAALPQGPVLKPGGEAEGALYTVGLDLSARSIRVFPEGEVLKRPASGKPHARLHHTAHSQPGTSGGAVLTAEGAFVGIATSGGAGRFEAIPAARIAALRAASGEEYAARSAEIGKAYRDCTLILEKARRSRDSLPEDVAAEMRRSCTASGNRQLFDLAGQVLGRNRMFEDSVAFFEKALEKDPNAINTRVSLVVTLLFARRAEEALEHVRWLVDVIPGSQQVQRFAVQVGKAAGDRALAERGLALIGEHNPQQLDAAKEFLEGDAPGPRSR